MVSRLHTPSTNSMDPITCQLIQRAHDRGACIGLSLFALPDTLLRGELRSTPSRAGNLHRRSALLLVSPRGSTCAQRQDASNSFLQPTFALRAPAEAPLLETWSIALGTPAGDRAEDLANAAFPPSIREDAGPPRGHPASNGRAFDGAQPALVTRQPRPRFRVTVGELPQLYRLTDSPAEANL